MGKEARTIRRNDLARAQDSLIHSGGTPHGQSCHFDPDAWDALRALVQSALKGQTFHLEEPSE